MQCVQVYFPAVNQTISRLNHKNGRANLPYTVIIMLIVILAVAEQFA